MLPCKSGPEYNTELLALLGVVEAKFHSEWPSKGLASGTPDSNDVLLCRQDASPSSAAADHDQGTAESQAETTAEMQADKAKKEATVASLLVELAGLPALEPSEEPPQLPHCLANVGGMQV